MASKLLLMILAGLVMAGVSGCTTAGAAASVEFDGEGNGVDADEADCNDDGTLAGSGSVEDGELTVRVMDGDGDTIFEESYRGDVALDGRALDGASGNWVIEATRTGDDLLGDFNGQYTFRLDC